MPRSCCGSSHYGSDSGEEPVPSHQPTPGWICVDDKITAAAPEYAPQSARTHLWAGAARAAGLEPSRRPYRHRAAGVFTEAGGAMLEKWSC